MDINPLTDSSVAEERRKICLTCPFVSENRRACTKCGCNIYLKTKFKFAKCPVGKWHKTSEEAANGFVEQE